MQVNNSWALQGSRSVATLLLQQTYSVRRRLKCIRLTEVDKAHMKRLVIMVTIKVCGEAILLTLVAGIAIGVIGHIKKWDTSLAYSNAFFIAGCLAIIAGASSRLGASQDWSRFQLLYAESFRDMSPGERANFMVAANSPVRLAILGLLSGVLLILISVFVTKVF